MIAVTVLVNPHGHLLRVSDQACGEGQGFYALILTEE
jgi:hypothetical protein